MTRGNCPGRSFGDQLPTKLPDATQEIASDAVARRERDAQVLATAEEGNQDAVPGLPVSVRSMAHDITTAEGESMTIRVGYRPGTPQGGSYAPRATLVGCDQPFCDKALHFPVDLQSSDAACIRATIRFLEINKGKEKVSGWVVDTSVSPTKFFCRNHAENHQLGTIILK